MLITDKLGIHDNNNKLTIKFRFEISEDYFTVLLPFISSLLSYKLWSQFREVV